MPSEPKHFWSRPSLSRDFWLLSGMVVVLSLISALWIAYESYLEYSEKAIEQLGAEAARIDRTMIIEIEHASYLVESLARQVAGSGTTDLVSIAKLFNSFVARTPTPNLFSWIDSNQRNAIDSNTGVVPDPPDLSDRDYVKKSLAQPWQIQLGRPVFGRTSHRWIIPIAMGITDDTSRFMGTLLLGLNLDALTAKLHRTIENPAVQFGVISRTFVPVTQSQQGERLFTERFLKEKLAGVDFDKNPNGVVTRASLFDPESMFVFYESSSRYPYVILTGITQAEARAEVLALLLPRLMPVALAVLFMLVMLALLKQRMVQPVMELTELTAGLARGERFDIRHRIGPLEIEALAQQLKKVSDYIDERLRLEDELMNKTARLRHAKETAELTNRIKVDFLTSISHELRTPLNNIIGFAEIMKNELYGPLQNDNYRQYAEDIYRSSQQLLEVVNDVLSLAKVESGLIELKEKPLKLDFILQKSLRLMQEKLAATNVQVRMQVSESLPKVQMDELRLKQVVLNVLNHLLQQMYAGGTLVIEARQANDEVEGAQLMLSFSTSSAERSGMRAVAPVRAARVQTPMSELTDFSGIALALAKTLAAIHNVGFEVEYLTGKGVIVTLRFAKERLVFWE